MALSCCYPPPKTPAASIFVSEQVKEKVVIMKEPTKTYVGLAVIFDRLADDGWPEDAGWWPIGGCTLPPVACSPRVQGIRRLFPFRFIKSLFRKRNRT